MTEPLGDRLRSIVLGGAERYTREEMARAARMAMDDVGSLWRAMGFADVGQARAFTDSDLSALLRVASLLERGLIDLDRVIEITRSMGQTTARLADWQVEALGRDLLPAGGPEQRLSGEAAAAGAEDLVDLLPELELLLAYVWRRQLAAAVGRVLEHQTVSADVSESQATVGFADLVSFTRLTRQLDDDELAAVVQTFESESADVVHAASARLVKTLGDEVMFVAETPQRAARIALELHRTHGRSSTIPQIRVGLATGGVVNRMGDVFGDTVNRASRFTALARPGTTVIDSATAEALQHSKQNDKKFSVRALTPRPVRGLGIIRPYALMPME